MLLAAVDLGTWIKNIHEYNIETGTVIIAAVSFFAGAWFFKGS